MQLLADPERYDGSRANVSGYLVFQDLEDDAAQGQLHLSREDAEHMLGNHIDVTAGACGDGEDKRKHVGMSKLIAGSMRYVHMSGTFFYPRGSAKPRGVLCSITDIWPIAESSAATGGGPSEKGHASTKNVPANAQR